MVYNPNNPWNPPFPTNYPCLPKQNSISSITQAFPCVVTTASAHGYSTGQQVRIFFPSPYESLFGMVQINGKTGYITVIDTTSFSLPIDTRSFNSFTTSSLQTAQVLPIGETNDSFSSVFTQVNPASSSNAGPLFQPPYPSWPGPI